ncbi:MAG: hypothetical protein R3F60_00325 [bacterium]
MRSFLLLLALCRIAGAVEGEVRVEASLLGLAEREAPAPLPDVIDAPLDREVAGLYLAVGGLLAVGPRIELSALFDTHVMEWKDGEVLAGGRPLGDEVAETALLREARLRLWLPAGLSLEAGKGRVRLGEGLIFDHYAAGLALGVDAPPFSLQIGVLWPGRDLVPDRPALVHARLAAHLDLTRSLFVFAAGDAPDAAVGGDSLRDLVAAVAPASSALARCADLRGDSVRAFFGGGLDFLLEDHWITAVGILQLGQADIEVYARERSDCGVGVRRILELFPRVDAPVRAFALDASWRVRASSLLFPGAFGTWLSGDDDPLAGRWTVFAPPAALVGRTALFFNAGPPILDQTLEVSGLDARGVRAVGASLLVAPSAELEVTGVVAWLEPDEGPGSYGAEYDLKARWRPDEAWEVQAEAAVLDEGDFFVNPGTWWQVSLVLAVRQVVPF